MPTHTSQKILGNMKVAGIEVVYNIRKLNSAQEGMQVHRKESVIKDWMTPM